MDIHNTQWMAHSFVKDKWSFCIPYKKKENKTGELKNGKKSRIFHVHKVVNFAVGIQNDSSISVETDA